MVKQSTKSNPASNAGHTIPASAGSKSAHVNANGKPALVVAPIVHPIDLSFREAEAVADFFEEIDQVNESNGVTIAPLALPTSTTNPATKNPSTSKAPTAPSSAAASSASGKNQDKQQGGGMSGGANDSSNAEQHADVANGGRALKLSYNQLVRLDGFQILLSKLQVYPASLRWLDLSFNSMTGVDESLAQCPKLTHLYLHANKMESLTQVARALGKMPWAPKLATLTLHGNPLSEHKDYKVHVLRACPRLRHLDHAGVTRGDRALVRHTHGVAPIGARR
ncbi:hypothetical protein BCR44DRAFT_69420, partial [Catenaria anguillulae PL171]